MNVDAQLAAIRDRLSDTLVAVDFDGTLAPIVPRPEDARALPGTADVLGMVAARVRQVAVITGRSAEEAVEFGDLATVPDLIVLGHYGLERWENGWIRTPPASEALGGLRRQLAELADARPGVTLEDKGHSVALHTRNAPDPAGSLDELIPLVSQAASVAGFQVTPGRFVVEARPAGVDKGEALRSLVAETGARAVLYVGDDTGDLPAVEALRSLAGAQIAGVVVCADADEADPRLRDAADVVVSGPEGVQALLRALATPPE
jgi:trehalose 6-phosphate phosphatase